MKFEFSAGGIVYKREGKSLMILVSQHSGHHGWVFPKGLIGDKDHLKGEGKEQTAVREVKEETGIEGKIIEEIEPAVFWYIWKEEKRKKTVYYFIMEYSGGNTADHDWEMEAVEWLGYEHVQERLTYDSDKKAYLRALPRIKKLAKMS